MAGMGAAPKDAHRRARANKDPNPSTRLEFQACVPPDLPADMDWHPMTRAWWKVWQNSPMALIMGPTDWASMLDTALLHHDMWKYRHWTVAAEVRLRCAQFGATPVDRLRLRIQWADADTKDVTRPQGAAVPNRWGDLKVLPVPKDSTA